MSAIYKLLKKLEENEMVDCTTELTEENRARKIYSITEEGAAALREKLADLLKEPEHIRWQADIAFYNLDVYEKAEQLMLLTEYRRQIEKKIGEYRELEAFMQSSDCPLYPLSISRRPVFLLEGEIRWLDTFIAEIDAQKL
jgi:DNA-binding PadR family transcriptional regulator